VTGVITVPVKSVCSIDKETDNTRVIAILKDLVYVSASLCYCYRLVVSSFVIVVALLPSLVLSSAAGLFYYRCPLPLIGYVAVVIASVIVAVLVLKLSFLVLSSTAFAV